MQVTNNIVTFAISKHCYTYYALSDIGVQAATEEEILRGEEEQEHADDLTACHTPESGDIAEMLRDDTPDEDPESHADVPRY